MTAIAPVITAFYAGLLGVLGVYLGIRVTSRRAGSGPVLGSGDDTTMQRTVRMHGNFAEWVPLTLILLALIEMIGAPPSAIHVFGIAVLVGRILHSLGIAGINEQLFRSIGGVVAYLSVLLISLYAIWLFFTGPIALPAAA